jgi:8-oxo-dGTP diphosphatase
MELIKEIYDDTSEQYTTNAYRIRKASRAVVINDRDEIALLFVTKGNYHKLPGGGIKDSETIYEALKREVEEEVGTLIEDIKELGITIEYRNNEELLQLSYGYMAKATGELKDPMYTNDEINDGFVLRWVPIKIAIEILKQDMPANYAGKFIQQRDLEFLLKADEVI